MALFLNRAEAGRQLAAVLVRYPFDGEAIVLALPRGGLPVAFEVAQRLRAPLDIYMVRKIGVPGIPSWPWCSRVRRELRRGRSADRKSRRDAGAVPGRADAN